MAKNRPKRRPTDLDTEIPPESRRTITQLPVRKVKRLDRSQEENQRAHALGGMDDVLARSERPERKIKKAG